MDVCFAKTVYTDKTCLLNRSMITTLAVVDSRSIQGSAVEHSSSGAVFINKIVVCVPVGSENVLIPPAGNSDDNLCRRTEDINIVTRASSNNDFVVVVVVVADV